jgi:hypothetical protein
MTDAPVLDAALRAPFPYFGGKRSAAAIVWGALGDVPAYVEPFAGSAAVLLARPAEHRPVRETINDADGFVSNFWRAVQADPDTVASHADFPVIERDLEARHHWLVTEGAARLAAVAGDPDAFCPQVAGWWVWGACAWIGSGWCAGSGPWVWNGAAWVSNAGRGINRQMPHLGDAGRGINRQMPHLGDAGQGEVIRAWFRALAARLRRVVVLGGDWRRALASDTASGVKQCGAVGVFLDPPYAGAERTAALYRCDGADVAAEVRAWCLTAGRDARYRIILAGYAGEGHEALEAAGWRATAALPKLRGAGYGNQGAAIANRQREMLWLSPAVPGLAQEALL